MDTGRSPWCAPRALGLVQNEGRRRTHRASLTARGLGLLRFLQSGQLPIYLLYILLTLVALLIWMVA